MKQVSKSNIKFTLIAFTYTERLLYNLCSTVLVKNISIDHHVHGHYYALLTVWICDGANFVTNWYCCLNSNMILITIKCFVFLYLNRSDARSDTEIILPTGTPFVLLRYGYACQSVHSMIVREVYLRWDDEDTLGSSSSGGAHPYDDGGSKDHTLHFCYYQSRSGPSIVG
jgi:hypothetical protein